MSTESEDWEAWRKRVLVRLANSLGHLVESSPADAEFFIFRLASEVDELCDSLEHYLESDQLFLRNAHTRSELILESAFLGRPADIFRGVHFAVDSRFMLSGIVSSWSERTDSLLDQGRLREIRRLVVFSDSKELLNPAARKFMTTESTRPGHLHRYVEEETLRKHLRAKNLSAPHDFGIYSTRYVFISSSREPADLSGTWSRNRDLVRDYIRMFDELWEISDTSPKMTT